MNPEFKHLLLRAAHLGTWDTRWLLRRLDDDARKKFETLGGLPLLRAARRFRPVPLPALPSPIPEEPLPKGHEALIGLPPLFVAIVLETWPESAATTWLSRYDHKGVVADARANALLTVKPPAREALISTWTAKGEENG